MLIRSLLPLVVLHVQRGQISSELLSWGATVLSSSHPHMKVTDAEERAQLLRQFAQEREEAKEHILALTDAQPVPPPLKLRSACKMRSRQ